MADKKYRQEQRQLSALTQRLEEWARYTEGDFEPFDRLVRDPENKKEREWQKRGRKRKIDRAEEDIANLERKLKLRPGYVIKALPISPHENKGFVYEVTYPNEKAS